MIVIMDLGKWSKPLYMIWGLTIIVLMIISVVNLIMISMRFSNLSIDELFVKLMINTVFLIFTISELSRTQKVLDNIEPKISSTSKLAKITVYIGGFMTLIFNDLLLLWVRADKNSIFIVDVLISSLIVSYANYVENYMEVSDS